MTETSIRDTSNDVLPPPVRTGTLLGLPRVFWLLWAGMLVNRVGGGVFCFLSVYLTHARGLTPALAGLVVGLYAAGGMVAGPVGGLLADRLGRRATLLVSTAVGASVMVSLGLARTVATIVVLAPLLGFFTDIGRPALAAAVADVVPTRDRRRAYGLLYWATNLGFSGAAALAGKLAERNYALLFVVDAATTLLFGLLLLTAVPETRPVRDPAAQSSYLREVAIPFRDRRFLLFAGIQLLVMMIFAQFTSALMLDMAAHGLSAQALGRILALNGVVIVLLQPLALRRFAQTPHHRLLAGAALLTGAGLGLAAPAGFAPVPVFAAAVAVLTCGEIAFSMAVPGLLADLAPPAHRGGYQGAHQLTWGFAGMTAPALGSLILATFGGTPLWLGCLGVGLVAAVLHATFTGRIAVRITS
jgi:MFS family permease